MPQQYNIIWTSHTSRLDEEPEPIQPPSKAWRITQGVIAFLFVLAMLWLYGFQQLTFFHKTPVDTETGNYEALITAEPAAVPVTVFVLQSEASADTTRSRQLIEQAEEILTQAQVQLSPVDIQIVSVPSDSQPGPRLVNDPEALRELLPELADDRLHVVVTETLGGINGIAFSGQRAVAVAEYTTSFDFRVLAHEIGHALGLSHTSDRSNLMNSGGSGTNLTIEQAQKAHDAASVFSRDGS